MSTTEPSLAAAPGATAWGIESIVEALRAQRVKAQGSRNHLCDCNLAKLPSPHVLAEVLHGLRAALFPNGLGPAGLSAEGVDYFVGDTLARALRDLTEQIRLELAFDEADPARCAGHEQRATAITREFTGYLPGIRALLETDMVAAYRGDPAARSVDEVLVCYPGFTAITYHRIAHVFYLAGLPLVARIISEIAHSATGIDIHPGATIGESFFIDHGTGVVIGETAIIGRNVRLYQAVTLGAKRFAAAEDGTLVKGNARHPIVEEDVVIYAGATVLGRITIGRGSTIGGNVWLTYSVPPGSNVTQAQSRAEAFQDGAGI